MMISKKQHRTAKLLIPFGVFALTLSLAVVVGEMPMVPKAAAIAVLASVLSAYLFALVPCQCPKCGGKMKYFPPTTSKMMGYKCTECELKTT